MLEECGLQNVIIVKGAFSMNNVTSNTMKITDVLKADHDKMRAMLEQLVDDASMTHEQRITLLHQIREEVVPHARAEEAVLYNSMRAAKGPTEMVYHGYAEHAEADMMMTTLAAAENMHIEWKTLVRKLKEELLHHFEEEEEELFKQADQFFTIEESEMMGDAFKYLKPKLRDQGTVRNVLDFIGNLIPARLLGSMRKMEQTAVGQN